MNSSVFTRKLLFGITAFVGFAVTLATLPIQHRTYVFSMSRGDYVEDVYIIRRQRSIGGGRYSRHYLDGIIESTGQQVTTEEHFFGITEQESKQVQSGKELRFRVFFSGRFLGIRAGARFKNGLAIIRPSQVHDPVVIFLCCNFTLIAGLIGLSFDIATNLRLRITNPTRKWDRKATELVCDLGKGELNGVRVGSSIADFEFLGKSNRFGDGLLEYFEKGVWLRLEGKRVVIISIVLLNSQHKNLDFSAFDGRLVINGELLKIPLEISKVEAIIGDSDRYERDADGAVAFYDCFNGFDLELEVSRKGNIKEILLGTSQA